MFKRGQQSSFGMSFGMLFSIILIIVFIATAFIVIRVFLDFGCSTNLGQFYDDLQDEINSAWRSSETSRSFSFDLCGQDKDVTHVCFGNLSAPITNQEMYDQIAYQDFSSNTFIIPSGAAGNLDIMTIDHLDIEKITEKENPYCVENPGELRVYKGLRSRLVALE